MKAVGFLEGKWAGEGWSQMGPGPKELFTVTETVEAKLGGAVMLIEGIGRSKDEDAKIGHHAMAVIAFDPKEDTRVFTSFVAGRSRQDLTLLEVGSQSLVRSFAVPNRGQVRYTIKVQDNVWHELGEISADGNTWQPFLEMKLRRQ